jgi:hypothetical protein
MATAIAVVNASAWPIIAAKRVKDALLRMPFTMLSTILGANSAAVVMAISDNNPEHRL